MRQRCKLDQRGSVAETHHTGDSYDSSSIATAHLLHSARRSVDGCNCMDHDTRRCLRCLPEGWCVRSRRDKSQVDSPFSVAIPYNQPSLHGALHDIARGWTHQQRRQQQHAASNVQNSPRLMQHSRRRSAHTCRIRALKKRILRAK